MTSFFGKVPLCALIAAAAILLVFPPMVAAGESDDLQHEYRRLSREYAASVPGWRPAPASTGSLLFVAPDEYSTTAKGHAANQFADSRRAYADKLFELAKRAADFGQMSLAFQWATETLRENPEHADARRVLGYEKQNGQWLTPYGIRMAEAGKSWQPRYGWIVAADLPRYDAGERLIGSRWLSAEEDAAKHREMKQGWQVRTDHFLVTTNHSLEAAADLAARLERLHQVWRQLFAGFYMTENEVRRLFAGERQPRKQVRPFRVYYHRDKDQYVNSLRRLQPRIADTLGIYFDTMRQAHFFAADAATAGSAVAPTGGPPVATLYHEAVHQLFQETKPAAKRVGELANFWVIEGVATYFESLREHNDTTAGLYFTVGDWDAGRLPAALERVQEGFYVPLAELTQLGKRDVQRHADVSKLYSQSSGLAAFLMEGEGGRYRESLVQYLADVYAGRDDTGTLSKSAGTSYSQLDGEYVRHAKSLP